MNGQDQKLFDRVAALIVETADGQMRAEDLKPSTLLKEDLGLDSLDRYYIVLDIENEIFRGERHLPDEEIRTWRSVEDVVRSTERMLDNSLAGRHPQIAGAR